MKSQNLLLRFFSIFFLTIAFVALIYITLRTVVQGADRADPSAASSAADELPTATATHLVPPSVEPEATDIIPTLPRPTPPPTLTPTATITPTIPPPAPTIALPPDSTNPLTPTEQQIAVVPTEPPPQPTQTPLPPTQGTATPVPTATEEQSVPTTTPPPPTPTPTATTAAQARPTATATSLSTPEAPIVVELRVLPGDTEGSWLRVTSDGIIVYEQIMRPGERDRFLAEQSINVLAGNPPVVEVRVNDSEPALIGEVPGVPATWSWPPLEPSPSPQPSPEQ